MKIVEVTPEANGGPRKGFTPIDGEVATLQSPGAMKLGQAVQAALEIANAPDSRRWAGTSSDIRSRSGKAIRPESLR